MNLGTVVIRLAALQAFSNELKRYAARISVDTSLGWYRGRGFLSPRQARNKLMRDPAPEFIFTEQRSYRRRKAYAKWFYWRRPIVKMESLRYACVNGQVVDLSVPAMP